MVDSALVQDGVVVPEVAGGGGRSGAEMAQH
jgi:hypothetical protein